MHDDGEPKSPTLLLPEAKQLGGGDGSFYLIEGTVRRALVDRGF
jgi:hypothetical protein